MPIEALQKNTGTSVFDERQKNALSVLVESLVVPLSNGSTKQVGRKISDYFIQNNREIYAGNKLADPDFYFRGLTALVNAFVKSTGKNINDYNSLKEFIQEIREEEDGGYLRFFISIVARDVMVIYCAYPFSEGDGLI